MLNSSHIEEYNVLEEIKPIGGISADALLAALESAKTTTNSQVRRLMLAMVRVRDADAKLSDAEAKGDLGDLAVLLNRIHAVLFGSASGQPALPLIEAASVPQGKGELADALSEFAHLRASVDHASAMVDALLHDAEVALQRIEQQWNARR
jgi:hypothetical protein